jgi:hypothetical protein
LVSRDTVLDKDGTTLRSVYFSHEDRRECICQAPCHKPWSGQLDNLNLSSEKRKLLDARIYGFSLKTEVCDEEVLDREWELLTIYAMELAGVPEAMRSRYVLPDRHRLGRSVLRHGVSLPSLGNGEAVGCDALADLVVFTEESHAELVEKMKHLTTRFFQSADQLSANGLQEVVKEMNSISIKLRGIGKKKRYSRNAHLSRFDLISMCLEKVYHLAPLWCQRILCSGFTMGRKSSSWSESINASIRRMAPRAGFLKNNYGLTKFVPDFDKYVDTHCDRSFALKSVKTTQPVSTFLEKDISTIKAYLSPYAVSTILHRANEGYQSYTFKEGSSLDKETIPAAMRSKVSALCREFGVSEGDDEIRYCKVSSLLAGVACRCTSGAPLSSDKEHTDENLLLKASLQVNTSEGPVVAIYTPAAACNIDLLSSLKEIVLYCSCQEQTSSGLPCPHQLRWILDVAPRAMQNIIWLCNPTFLRGYSVPPIGSISVSALVENPMPGESVSRDCQDSIRGRRKRNCASAVGISSSAASAGGTAGAGLTEGWRQRRPRPGQGHGRSGFPDSESVSCASSSFGCFS